MANSKYLEFQDTDATGLIDKCDDLTIVPQETACPSCKRDLHYIAPDWKTKDEDSPWLNKKTCKYQ